MELRQIRYALAVAHNRNFTRAAERLNISQSAVSEQIKLLEAEIGFPLFGRTGYGIELTERGRIFLNEADHLVSNVHGLVELARRLKGGPAETIIVGMSSGLAAIFIPQIFAAGRSKNDKNMRIEIVTAPTRTIFGQLYDEQIDIGLTIESDPARVPSGIVFERLLVVPLVIIAHPGHRLARSRKAVEITILSEEPIIMNELSVGYGQIVFSLFTDRGLSPNIVAVADNVETMKVMVQAEAGIAIVPRACVQNEVALGVLKMVELAPPSGVALSLFRRRTALSRGKEVYVAKLRDMLKESNADPPSKNPMAAS